MTEILVVANRTAECEELQQALKAGHTTGLPVTHVVGSEVK